MTEIANFSVFPNMVEEGILRDAKDPGQVKLESHS